MFEHHLMRIRSTLGKSTAGGDLEGAPFRSHAGALRDVDEPALGDLAVLGGDLQVESRQEAPLQVEPVVAEGEGFFVVLDGVQVAAFDETFRNGLLACMRAHVTQLCKADRPDGF